MFKQVPMKIVVPIIVITWILSIVSALAIASSDVFSLGTVGPEGPQGDKGDTGATGPAGPQGPPGPTLIKFATQYNQDLSTSYSKVCTVTLTAPSNGSVHVIATCYVAGSGNNSIAYLGVGNDTSGNSPYSGTVVESGIRNDPGYSTTYYAPLNLTNVPQYWSLTSQGVFAVQEGVTYTFYASAEKYYSAPSSVTLYNIYLVAEFFGS